MGGRGSGTWAIFCLLRRIRELHQKRRHRDSASSLPRDIFFCPNKRWLTLPYHNTSPSLNFLKNPFWKWVSLEAAPFLLSLTVWNSEQGLWHWIFIGYGINLISLSTAETGSWLIKVYLVENMLQHSWLSCWFGHLDPISEYWFESQLLFIDSDFHLGSGLSWSRELFLHRQQSCCELPEMSVLLQLLVLCTKAISLSPKVLLK